MKHLTLTLSLILGLATSVSANDKDFAVGDVFFCETKKSVGWVWADEKQLQSYNLERFKFSIVDSKTLKFGKDGSFNDYVMEITYMKGKILEAKTYYARLVLHKNNFNFSSSHGSGSSFQVATCDRF